MGRAGVREDGQVKIGGFEGARGRKRSRLRHKVVAPFVVTGRLRTKMALRMGRSFSWGN